MAYAVKTYAWEGTLVSILVGVVVTLTLVSHLTARPDSLTSTQAGLGSTVPTSKPREKSPAIPRKSAGPTKRSNPLEVVLGPSSIGGQFTLLGIDRTTSTPISDKLTLHLRLASRAMADLVTPVQYVILEVHAPGLDPISLEHPFSRPVPAGTTRDEDIAFIVPSTLALDRSVLRIHFYNEQREIPLGLLSKGS